MFSWEQQRLSDGPRQDNSQSSKESADWELPAGKWIPVRGPSPGQHANIRNDLEALLSRRLKEEGKTSLHSCADGRNVQVVISYRFLLSMSISERRGPLKAGMCKRLNTSCSSWDGKASCRCDGAQQKVSGDGGRVSASSDELLQDLGSNIHKKMNILWGLSIKLRPFFPCCVSIFLWFKWFLR